MHMGQSIGVIALAGLIGVGLAQGSKPSESTAAVTAPAMAMPMEVAPMAATPVASVPVRSDETCRNANWNLFREQVKAHYAHSDADEALFSAQTASEQKEPGNNAMCGTLSEFIIASKLELSARLQCPGFAIPTSEEPDKLSADIVEYTTAMQNVGCR